MKFRSLITGTLLAGGFVGFSLLWRGNVVLEDGGQDNLPTHSLLVTFSDNLPREGQLVIQLYDDARDFLKRREPLDECFLRLDISDEIIWEFSDLPAGSYVVAAFHDRNENWAFDPDSTEELEERVGYSRIVSADNRSPTFQEAALELNADRAIQVQLH
ncbi:MAG: DUF2141 domain-containing protein [Planctomycetota bacterium]|nr:DUF2141 domain-containing protein [Planctomycetota bacterium]